MVGDPNRLTIPFGWGISTVFPVREDCRQLPLLIDAFAGTVLTGFEGDLDSLVLAGSAGTAAVQLVTPSYALLLKTGAGVATGRIRFEAARAAEQLRPALL